MKQLGIRRRIRRNEYLPFVSLDDRRIAPSAAGSIIGAITYSGTLNVITPGFSIVGQNLVCDNSLASGTYNVLITETVGSYTKNNIVQVYVDASKPAVTASFARQYWRILFTTGIGTNAQYTEYRFKDSEGNPLTGSGTPTASSEFNATYAIAKGFDGVVNDTSRHAFAGKPSPSWVQYDFGEPVEVSQVETVYSTFSEHYRSLRVQSSEDGSTWETVSGIPYMNKDANYEVESVSFTSDLRPTIWQLYGDVTNIASGQIAQYAGIELFEADGTPIPILYIDSLEGHRAGNEPCYLADDTLATKWASNISGNGSTLLFYCDPQYNLARVKFTAVNEGTQCQQAWTGITLKKSTNGGSTFSDVASVTNIPVPTQAKQFYVDFAASYPELKPYYYFANIPIPMGSSMTAIEAGLIENADIANEGVYYVKPSTGSDSNDGSIGSPFATVTKAIKTATGEASRVVMLEDAVIEPFDLRSTDASQSTQQFKWLDANGYNVIIRVAGPDLSAQTWTQDGTYTNCYKATLSVGTNGQVTRVLKSTTLDDYGYDMPLRKYASAAALDVGSDPGWYWDNTGKVLWVATGVDFETEKEDYRALYLNSAGTSRMLVYGAALGLSGVTLDGVYIFPLDQNGRRPEIWMHNCKSLYSPNKGIDLRGWAVLTNSQFYAAAFDAVNGFQEWAGGPSFIQSVNCEFIRCGDRRTFDVNATYQGISAHGGCDHISFGSQFIENNGQGVADTCLNGVNNYTWLRSCSTTGGADSVNVANYLFGSGTTGTRKVWMDSCTSNSASTEDLTVNADATVYTLNTTLGSISGTTLEY